MTQGFIQGGKRRRLRAMRVSFTARADGAMAAQNRL
jgi:hypothetical protein